MVYCINTFRSWPGQPILQVIFYFIVFLELPDFENLFLHTSIIPRRVVSKNNVADSHRIDLIPFSSSIMNSYLLFTPFVFRTRIPAPVRRRLQLFGPRAVPGESGGSLELMQLYQHYSPRVQSKKHYSGLDPIYLESIPYERTRKNIAHDHPDDAGHGEFFR